MSYSKANAVAPGSGRARLFLKAEEILQGVMGGGQNAINVTTTQSSSAPSNSAPITTAADITLAAGDKLFIQNLDTDALFVRRGTGATSSLFNYVLQAAGVADDGTGGALVIDDFVGVVSFAGTTVRYNAWKA